MQNKGGDLLQLYCRGYLPATLGRELVSGRGQQSAPCQLSCSSREMNHLTWSVVIGEHLLLFFRPRTQVFSHPVHLWVPCFLVSTTSLAPESLPSVQPPPLLSFRPTHLCSYMLDTRRLHPPPRRSSTDFFFFVVVVKFKMYIFYFMCR